MTVSTLCSAVLAAGVGLFVAAGPLPAEEPPAPPVELKVGDPAPTFQLRDDRDKVWSSSDHFVKKWVVIYFYPGDFTPGCTAQARAFNAAMEKLTEKGVEVVGVSGDSVETHKLFKDAHRLKFALLADPDGTVARQFGVPFGKGATVKARDATNKPLMIEGKQHEFERKGTAARWTYVIGPDGTVAYKNVKVTPAVDAKAIGDFIDTASAKK
jgi:peroxiredoxin Q/BCP